MADLKKFLDRAGVSTLWGAVVDNIDAKVKVEKERAIAEEAKIAQAAATAQAAAEAADAKAVAVDTKVGTIKAVNGVTPVDVIGYVDAKTAGIATDAALADLRGIVDGHTTSIGTLSTDVENLKKFDHSTYALKTEVEALEARAAQDAQDKADAAENAAVDRVLGYLAEEEVNTAYDTLKEIAAYIESDTTGAAQMATDISDLKTLVGTEAVSKQIDDAIKAQDLSKYVDGDELTTALTPYAKIADVNTGLDLKADKSTVNGIDSRLQAVEAFDHSVYAKTTDMNSAIATAKSEANAYADGKAATAESNAKTYAKEYADGLAGNYATKAQGQLADAAVRGVVFSENAAGVMQASVNTGGNTVVYDLFAALTAEEIQQIINGTQA